MKRFSLVCALLFVAAGLVACGDDEARSALTVGLDDEILTVSGDPSSGAVDITFSGDFEPGTEVELTRVSEGTTPDEFVDSIAVVLEGGPFPEFFLDNAGAVSGGEVDPSVTLQKGSYFVWVESENDGIVYTEMTIDDDGDADLPDTDGIITARDYGFTIDVKPGSTYTFRNEGVQFHHVVLFDFGTLDPAV